ncbi:hypothetical protein [Rhodoferax sp. UBA5149]|uniref:hypothetical protein n=1 Tax=Rhodoferax sp. UBA5149 TaxID=1947379 RepID=UPI0025D4B67A|nr:hypothetical protein [Rhodoferax sp. UBA5149]
MRHALWMLALAALLVACGEKPQTGGVTKRDASAYSGTGKAFVDGGWKQGDQASWESHLKARTQQGQNDYNRIN